MRMRPTPSQRRRSLIRLAACIGPSALCGLLAGRTMIERGSAGVAAWGSVLLIVATMLLAFLGIKASNYLREVLDRR